MAGSLGLGIGFEEHHVGNIRAGGGGGVVHYGWDSLLCTTGIWNPDCGCCCQIFPPDSSNLATLDPDWTLMWGTDINGNIYPEDELLLSADGYWEVESVGGLNMIVPVSVLSCDVINPAVGVISGCPGC